MGLTKATITNLDKQETFSCLFNPTEYTISKVNSWQAKPVIGKNVPRLDFTGGGARILSLELFFDVYEQEGADVRVFVDKLWELTLIDRRTRNQKTQRARPPLCLFQWGGHWHFKAAITALAVRYTLFRQDGTPVRAIAQATFQEAEDTQETQRSQHTHSPSGSGVAAPSSPAGGKPGRKWREVQTHDTLPLIAHAEYGDPALWRPIAEENQISDPMTLTVGERIAIPPAPLAMQRGTRAAEAPTGRLASERARPLLRGPRGANQGGN